MGQRPVCPYCRIRPLAINYYKGGRVYYRSKCVQCYRRKVTKVSPLPPPGWLKSGYKKKDRCERCHFRFKHHEQAQVYHLDGNTANNDWFNLRTVCANCAIEILHGNLGWKPDAGGLTPDY